MTSLAKGFSRGLMAGSTGTTALNAVSYLDMAVRARAASDAPEQVVATAAQELGHPVPGRGNDRDNRVAGLAGLTGMASGLVVGGLAGVVRAAGVRLPALLGGPLIGVASMAASDVPIAVLGVDDPASWTRRDWLADAVPHLAYGITTHAALVAAEDDGPPPVSGATVLASVALGAATGGRTTAGITAVALTGRSTDRGRVGSSLAHPGTKAVTALLAAGELAGDKLPQTPSRLEPQGLVPRILLGAASAAVAARRVNDAAAVPAALGALSAVAVAGLAVRARAAATDRFGSDLTGALAEDALVAGLAWFGARRRTPNPVLRSV